MKARSTTQDLFARLAPAYEMLASPTRLQAEVRSMLPHLRAIGAVHVLDAGCAVGFHSLELARQGFRVTGIDLSKEMIEEARRRSAGLGLPVRFFRRDLREADRLPGPASDAVLCLGNTMASIASPADRRKSLVAFRKAMRPGGLLLLQLRDLTAVKGSGHVFPVRTYTRGGEEWIFLRRQDPDPQGIRFRSTLLHRQNGGSDWQMIEGESIQQVLGPGVWREEVRSAGFERIRLASDLGGTPRKPGKGAADLVIIARRAG